MKVPAYDQSVKQQGLPSVKQSANVNANSFLTTAQESLGGAEDAFNHASTAAMHIHRQQVEEMDGIRAQDAVNKLAEHDLNAQYGKDGQGGWLNQRGEAAFKQPNGKSLNTNIMDERSKVISSISESLGTERQRQLFSQHAAQSSIHLSAQLMGHEAEQSRVYTRGVHTATIKGEMRNIGLNYNDQNALKQSIDSINSASVALAKLEGFDESYGKLQAQGAVSDALKAANSAALQHGNTSVALSNLDHFKDHLDPNDRTHMESAITGNYVASEIQNNPTAAVQLFSTDRLKNAILMKESGGRNLGKDGKPLVSTDGARSTGAMQVTYATAHNPGFGIKPIADESVEEYNRVGNELVDKLKEKYQGDPAKIFAAYNAGSGALDKAIAQGGESWQQYIPKSTRDDYIPKAMAFMKTGTPLDIMSDKDRLQALTAAKSAEQRGRAVFAADLSNQVNNQFAQAAVTGNPGEMLSEAAFIQAHGDNGPQAYADYVDKIDHAKQYHSIKDLPAAEANAMLEAAKPKEGTPEFYREQGQYEKLASALKAANEARNADPMAYAYHAGYSVQPINWNNPAQAAKELSGRMAVSNQLREKYGTEPTLLTKDEAAHLSHTFDAMPTKDALSLMDTLKKGSDSKSYSMAMQQLHKDSPVTALAGSLYGIDKQYSETHWYKKDSIINANGQKAAEYVLKGERLLNPSKGDKSEDGKSTNLFMPSETDLKFAFNEASNGAFANRPKAADQAYQATKAAYAALMAESGDTSKTFNSDAFSKALTMVTGGIVKTSSGRIIPPYGMPEDVFTDKIDQQYKQQLNAMGISHEIHPLSNYKMFMLGENQYGLADGNTPIPIVLDLNK